jgi:hypothetical protein
VNARLHVAKRRRSDEFYTRYEDIEAEVRAYVEHDPDVFRDKVVLLPCDDRDRSEFVRYFLDHFDAYGLRALVASCYVEGGRGRWLKRVPGGTLRGEHRGDGDFRSAEVAALLDGADIVVTNPPFSLFREFMARLGGKRFLVLGNMNAATYKEVWPLIADGRVRLGVSRMRARTYTLPDGSGQTLANTCWFTNMDHGRRRGPLPLSDASGHRRYDNCDAIEVPRLRDIPDGYDGVMGVPITFLDHHDPDQFEIVGFRYGDDGRDLRVDGRPTYFRILVRRRNAGA